MIQTPTVLGLILCEHVDVDRATGRFSLVGLFHVRRFRDYPTPPQAFAAYAALFDGIGEGKLELVIHRVETGEDVYTYKRWLAFPGRQMTLHLEIRIKRCAFPAPGRYDVSLRFNGEELTHRFLDVRQG